MPGLAATLRGVEDEVWVELDRDAGTVLWAEFADRYQFRAGTKPDKWPAIVEPDPSVVWDLGPIFTGEYPGRLPDRQRCLRSPRR